VNQQRKEIENKNDILELVHSQNVIKDCSSKKKADLLLTAPNRFKNCFNNQSKFNLLL